MVEKAGDRRRRGVLKLLVSFGVKQLAMLVENCECRNTFGNGNVIFACDVDVLVHVADVDVDEDEMFGKELGVGAMVVINVEHLAVAAPVAAKVEQYAFVLAACLGDGDGDIGRGVGTLGV